MFLGRCLQHLKLKWTLRVFWLETFICAAAIRVMWIQRRSVARKMGSMIQLWWITEKQLQFKTAVAGWHQSGLPNSFKFGYQIDSCTRHNHQNKQEGKRLQCSSGRWAWLWRWRTKLRSMYGYTRPSKNCGWFHWQSTWFRSVTMAGDAWIIRNFICWLGKLPCFNRYYQGTGLHSFKRSYYSENWRRL